MEKNKASPTEPSQRTIKALSLARSSAAGFCEETKQAWLLLKLFTAVSCPKPVFLSRRNIAEFLYVSKKGCKVWCFQGRKTTIGFDSFSHLWHKWYVRLSFSVSGQPETQWSPNFLERTLCYTSEKHDEIIYQFLPMTESLGSGSCFGELLALVRPCWWLIGAHCISGRYWWLFSKYATSIIKC